MADTYYVGSGGNNGNTGLSFAQRWLTTAYAEANAAANSSIRLCAVATETISAYIDMGGTSNLHFIGANGSDGSVDGTQYTLKQTGARLAQMVRWNTTTTGTSWENIIFDGSDNCGVAGVSISTNNTGMMFKSCEIKNMDIGGITGTGALIAVVDTHIHDCRGGNEWALYNFAGNGGFIVSGCLIHDCDRGIDTYFQSVVIGTVIHSLDTGLAVAIAGSGGGSVVSGNTIYNTPTHAIDIGAGNVQVTDNTCSEIGGYSYRYNGNWPGAVGNNHSHNATSGASDFTGERETSNGMPGSDNIVGDPLFTSVVPGSEDFQPQSGSPLVTAGLGSQTIGAKEPATGGGTFASVDDVRLGVDRGDGQLGTSRAADVDDQRLGVVFDANDSLTGTVREASINDQRLGAVFGANDSLTGNVRAALVGQVVDGVVYDTLDSLTGTFTCTGATSGGVVGRKLKQQAVYWAPDTLDDYGQLSFVGGVDLVVRWQDVQQLFVDSNGEERTSRAIAYFNSTSTDRRINGRLFLGNAASLSAEQLADPTLVDDAWVIQQYQKSPSLRAGETLGKVFM